MARCNAVPFPWHGPLLRTSRLWPEVHHWLITLIAETLVPQVRPNYRVAIEKRIYEISQPETGGNGNSLLVGIPDVSVHRQSVQQQSKTQTTVAVAQPQTVTIPMLEQVKQAYLEIREMQTGQVVTAIEILSPVNKCPGEGRNAYLQKRQRILSSLTHLIEIDLLRGWQAMPVIDSPTAGDYRILVSQSDRRPSADLYTVALTDPLPTLPIPLLRKDELATVDLQALLTAVYDRGGFDYVLDYSRPLNPPLPDDQADWANQLLAEHQLQGDATNG